MLERSNNDRHFWEKIADNYANQPISDDDTYQKKLEITRKYLSPESEVFEFGCGTGSTAVLHAPFVGHILATDISENMLEHGRKRAAEEGVENITFVCTSIEDYVGNTEQYDVVLALNILHLCRDPLAVMRQAHALLKPGGVLIQSTACIKNRMPLIGMAIPIMQLIGKAPYVNKFSTDDLHQMIDQAGFHMVEDWFPGGRSADFIVSKKGLD